MEVQSACRRNTQDLTDADFIDSSLNNEETTPTKREFPRRTAKWSVSIKTTQGKRVKGLTVNVSQEGMMVSLPCNLQKESKIFINATIFYQGSQLDLQGVARVKHSSISGSHFNIGFQFTVATELTTRFLGNYAAGKV